MRKLADLPSPEGLPLIGNLLQLSPDRLHLTLEQWSRELGSTYTIDLGTKRALVCCDPELAHTVLRDRPEGDALVCARLDDLKRLDAFEALATEATRLKPIVPVFFKEALVDKVLGGVALPAGTPVFFVLRPAMLDEQRFGHAGTFMPGRWGDDRNAALAHDARAYVQFGAGPRVCPGRELAGVEIRLVLSMLCRNFTMELATERSAIREVMAFTMMPSAMPVRLRSRG
jgi:cytochrome P450